MRYTISLISFILYYIRSFSLRAFWDELDDFTFVYSDIIDYFALSYLCDACLDDRSVHIAMQSIARSAVVKTDVI